jgi:PAS domain S-box-containing protein
MHSNTSHLPENAINLAEQKQAVLASIISTSDDCIISKTLDGIITSWNPAAERMFGYKEQEVIGRHISIIIPSERLDEEAYIIGQIVKGSLVEHFETVRRASDGSLVPISLTVSPIRDGSGVVIGASKIVRDISERLVADEKQSILAAIVASSDDAIISKTLKGIITSWNPAAERLFGHTEAEAVGKHISLIIPQDRLSEEDVIIASIARGDKIDHFETVRMGKNGRLIPISVTISPIFDRAGRVIGASKIARDISISKKVSEKQGMLAAIVDSSDDTILSKTLEGIITSWNRAAERMFGYSASEAVGRHISLIIPKDRLSEETFIIGQVSQGKKVDHFETIRVTKDGREVAISLSVSPILDETGKVIGASKIARDISEHRAIQQERDRLYEQAKALNDKKDEFIGLASHELKTPLTSISGYLHILNMITTDDRSKSFVGKTLQQVNKLTALVSDLLDVSKIEAGKLKLAKRPFELRDVVDDVIELMAHGNHKYQIELETDVDKLMVNGDAQRIEQVIINFITNAIRYSPGQSKVIVYLQHEADMVKIGVRDFGIGIARDKLKDVFGRFYRVDDEGSTISGLGIGLFLAHEVVSRHNGQIWVESEPGRGSVFWFTLPLN